MDRKEVKKMGKKISVSDYKALEVSSREDSQAKNGVEKIRRGGLAGADRAGTW